MRKIDGNCETKKEVGLTVEEVIEYQKTVKPTKHVYGKYGTLAQKYLPEHNVGKYWALAGDLPEYLHNVDKQADRLYTVMYNKLSVSERFKKTGDFIKDLQIETEKQRLIEEEILTSLVYVEWWGDNMKTVISVLVGIMKIFFLGLVFLWTFVMNVVGYLISIIGLQK